MRATSSASFLSPSISIQLSFVEKKDHKDHFTEVPPLMVLWTTMFQFANHLGKIASHHTEMRLSPGCPLLLPILFQS